MAEEADIPLGLFERLQKIARERSTASWRSACRT